MHAVFEFRGLPVGTVTSDLTDELQITVEPLESARAERRRYLPLQTGLRLVVRTAVRLAYGPETSFSGIAFSVGFARNGCGRSSGHGRSRCSRHPARTASAARGEQNRQACDRTRRCNPADVTGVITRCHSCLLSNTPRFLPIGPSCSFDNRHRECQRAIGRIDLIVESKPCRLFSYSTAKYASLLDLGRSAQSFLQNTGPNPAPVNCCAASIDCDTDRHEISDPHCSSGLVSTSVLRLVPNARVSGFLLRSDAASLCRCSFWPPIPACLPRAGGRCAFRSHQVARDPGRFHARAGRCPRNWRSARRLGRHAVHPAIAYLRMFRKGQGKCCGSQTLALPIRGNGAGRTRSA